MHRGTPRSSPPVRSTPQPRRSPGGGGGGSVLDYTWAMSVVWCMVWLAGVGLVNCNGLIRVRREGERVSDSELGVLGYEALDARDDFVTVRSCVELRRAISQGFHMVRIGEDITCTRDNWKTPLITSKNVEVSGEAEVEGGGIPVINWTDLRGAIVAENGAVVFFQSLRMRQVAMGIGGLDMSFIKTRSGAVGVFAGVVVGVDSCPLPVTLYNDLSIELPRPKFLSGHQRTAVSAEDSLLVQDIALWWPNTGSMWQICNTMFICGDREHDSVVNKLLEADVPSASCDQIDLDALPLSTEGASQAQNGQSKWIRDVLLASAGVLVAVATLSAVVAVAYLLRAKQRRKQIVVDEAQNAGVESKPTVPILQITAASGEFI